MHTSSSENPNMEGKMARNSSSSSTSVIRSPKNKLPEDILEHIGKSGKSASDYLRFRATCKTLFTNLTPHPRHLPLQPPFLMLSPTGADGSRSRFFNLARFSTYNFPRVANITRGKICFGSSFGWIFLVDYHFITSLLNPFTGVEIPLPPLDTIPGFFNILPLDVPAPQLLALLSGHHPDNIKEEEIADMIIHQAALSSDPSLDPQAVVLIIIKTYESYRFYYCQPRSISWTSIEIPGDPIDYLFDFIPFPERQFYAVVCDDRLLGFDFRSLPVRVTVTKLEDMPRCSSAYLVASAGELLLISEDYKISDQYDRIIKLFHVHKIDLDDLDNEEEYVPVHRVPCLGDRVVFLGSGQSCCFSTQDFPEFREDCIYFADSYNKQVGREFVRVDCIELFSLEEYNTEDIFIFSEEEKTELPRYKPNIPWLVSPNLSKGDT